MTLSSKHQSARMSKITNDGLTWSGIKGRQRGLCVRHLLFLFVIYELYACFLLTCRMW